MPNFANYILHLYTHRIAGLFVLLPQGNVGWECKARREALQGQTFHRRDAANAELVLDDGDAVGVCPHICFECKLYAVLARLYAVIGKTVELLIVPNSGNHSIISIISGIKIKCLISLACSINDIGDPSC